jgi:hypothetical protein
MRVMLRILCVVALVLSATFRAQADETVAVLIRGGKNSCAWWMQSPNHKVAGEAYVLGIWDGANMWNKYNHRVGENESMRIIFAEVEQVCAGHASKPLLEAAMEVYSLPYEERPRSRSLVPSRCRRRV